jgi:hypothetical protein
MLVHSGPDLPYLYPPFLLPLLVPIAGLPRDLVIDVWLIAGLLVSVWTCRRLAIPWFAIPFVLAWPPFLEGLVTGNVQLFTFAAFVGLVYEPADGVLRQRSFGRARARANGLIGAAIGALKIAQLVALLYLLRRQKRAVFVAALVLAMLVLVTLPLTGVPVYSDWQAQVQRAADPNWGPGGVAFGRHFGIPDLVLVAASVAVAVTAKGPNSAAWLGIAMLLVPTNVHGYTYLFLLPGLLTVRRDLAIVIAALFLGPYPEAWWLATGLVVVVLVGLSRSRRLGAGNANGAQPRPESGRGRAAAIPLQEQGRKLWGNPPIPGDRPVGSG